MLKKSLFLCIFFSLHAHATIKQNHLEGGWFSHDKKQLAIELKQSTQEAKKNYGATIDGKKIRAAIVPHAGMQYSGAVAAAVYRQCNPAVKKIFIIGPDHSGTIQGVALPSFRGFDTPMGTVFTDSNTIAALQHQPLFGVDNAIYNTEHSIQMQLPFIHYFFKNAYIVPLIVGAITCEQAATIAAALKMHITHNSLVVISSDFVHHGPRFHFQPFKEQIQLNVRQLDSQAIHLIQAQECAPFEQFIAKTGATICGKSAIEILLMLLHDNAFRAVEPRLIAYETSAQFDQEPNSVSYVGMVFTTELLSSLPAENRLTNYEKKSLITQARDILNNMFTPNFDASLYRPITSFALQQKSGVFTTIETLDGTLRGCIGHIVTQDPLYDTVVQTTQSAALHDTRFKPITEEETKQVRLKLSILSEPKTITNYRTISLGKDGVILSAQEKSAVFLPEVATEWKWTLPQMLTQLALKADLPGDIWKDKQSHFKTFTTFDIKES